MDGPQLARCGNMDDGNVIVNDKSKLWKTVYCLVLQHLW